MRCLTCENCGCRLDHGICSNCHEESYIVEFQAEFIDSPLSDEFVNRMKEQEGEIRNNQKKHVNGDYQCLGYKKGRLEDRGW